MGDKSSVLLSEVGAREIKDKKCVYYLSISLSKVHTRHILKGPRNHVEKKSLNTLTNWQAYTEDILDSQFI